jgi:hypothetical protein
MIQRRTGPAGKDWLLLLALLAAVLPGCKGEYERRLGLLVDQLGKSSEFNDLRQAVPINFPSATVTLHLPADLVAVDATADAKRSKFTIAEPLPENNLSDMLTYEGPVADSAGGKQHYYLYVGSLNLAEGGNDDMAVFVGHLTQVIHTLTGFEEVQVATRDGSMVTCRKGKATMQQVFYYEKPKGEGGEYPLMDGLIEVWDLKIAPAKKHLVLIWRVPSTLVGTSVDLDKIAPLVAGGIEVAAK